MRWISLGPWVETTSATADRRIGVPLAVLALPALFVLVELLALVVAVEVALVADGPLAARCPE